MQQNEGQKWYFGKIANNGQKSSYLSDLLCSPLPVSAEMTGIREAQTGIQQGEDATKGGDRSGCLEERSAFTGGPSLLMAQAFWSLKSFFTPHWMPSERNTDHQDLTA